MINASAECKKAINENSKAILKGSIDFANGTRMELLGTDFMGNTFSLSQASSSTSAFEIGAAVIGKASFSLNNYDGKFDTFDFTDSIITIWVGVPLKNGLTEWIKKGVFTIEQPDTYGSTISLSAYDNLSKFEKPYSEVTTSYPATLQMILTDICLHCGVSIGFAQFDNYNFSIPIRPDDSAMSCLDMVSYVAQTAGYFAMCDTDGRLKLKWYDMGVLDSSSLNGGVFDNASPYASGDNAYGGNFTDYSSGDNFFGGNFTDEYLNLFAFTGFSVCTDDVVITGIKVIAQEDEKEISIYGTEDYVLTISDNPLITSKNKDLIAAYLGQRIVGMRFRPFSLQAQADPTIEPGDCCYITDGKGNTYRSVITSLNYRIGSRESLSCNAETPGRNKADYHSQLSKTVTELRKNQKKELSNYDKQVQAMNQLAINAMGFYQTVEVDETDGSQIVYMHDKPSIPDSKVVYKETIDGFFLSQDGGRTYIYGRDSSGNAVVNILSSIGIVCDWIKGGTLTLGGQNNINGDIEFLDNEGERYGFINNNGYVINNDKYHYAVIYGNLTMSYRDELRYMWSDTWCNNIMHCIEMHHNKKNSNGATDFSADINLVIDEGTGAYIEISGSIPYYGNINIHATNAGCGIDIGRAKYYENYLAIGDYSVKSVYGYLMGDYSLSKYGFEYGKISMNPKFGYMFSQYVQVGDPLGKYVKIHSSGIDVSDGFVICGSLTVSSGGTKSKTVKTQNYSNRLLYCYETPKPYFGDIGEAALDENGLCYVFVDDIFYETINTECRYQVFLQKYGQGDVWVRERLPTYFVVEGTPNLSFGWELKARQLGFETERLETYSKPEKEESIDYEAEANKYMENYYKEILNYEESN